MSEEPERTIKERKKKKPQPNGRMWEEVDPSKPTVDVAEAE